MCAPQRIDAQAGTSFGFDETGLHRLVVGADERVVTIHAYSLPREAMGVYRLADDGSLAPAQRRLGSAPRRLHRTRLATAAIHEA